ncbi:hypothetical protein OH76DRAFT_1055543 [Lentinus brumalis]|uniref:Uncharacterized protein n=1 Tax=Lentinus brumalis TaxID=2498619 RepID=A0A371DN64_9APHY|nr:hypothetical protein OH76DRAFT_1055543 [Polyporus brumalis]
MRWANMRASSLPSLSASVIGGYSGSCNLNQLSSSIRADRLSSCSPECSRYAYLVAHGAIRTKFCPRRRPPPTNSTYRLVFVSGPDGGRRSEPACA